MKTIITMVIILAATWLSAQTWYPINPSTGLNGLQDISMLNTSHGIAVGNNGVILEYNGMGWSHMESPVNGNLRAVHFLNSNAAWAVGDNGTIIHYNGNQWVQQNSNTSAHLWDVFLLDENTGWAVGNTLLKYNGQGWEVEMEETGLNAIHFYDASEGWIVGTYGRTLKHDGNGWTLVTGATDDKILTDVFMTGPASGWRCGFTVGGGSVFQEYDGTNWQNAGTYARPGYGLSFTNHDHGWVIYNPTAPIIELAGIYQITDGTWNCSYTTGEMGWQIQYTGVDAVDEYHAFVSATTGHIYHYQNGNWEPGNAFADNHLYSIDFITPTHGRVAAGVRGIQRYENGNWTTELNADGFHYNNVSFNGSENGWATANKFDEEPPLAISRLYKYSGGEWSVFYEESWLGPFELVYAIDADQIWVVGAENQLMYFDQQGFSGWHYDLNIDIIKSLHFTDANNGWIAGLRIDAGLNGVILRLQDGEWSTIYVNPDQSISDFSFMEDGTAYAVGEEGLLLHYDGNTWSEITSPSGTSLHTIHMIDNQHGWAAGENGVVLYYDGVSWSLYEQNLGKTILSICFPEPGFGLMGGLNGAVFATQPQLPVGIEEPIRLEKTLGLTIFPNPAKDHITFVLENTEHHRNITLRCFNLLGMQQHQTTILRGQQQASANVSAWPPGMYIAVVLSDGKSVGRGKFVVQR